MTRLISSIAALTVGVIVGCGSSFQSGEGATAGAGGASAGSGGSGTTAGSSSGGRAGVSSGGSAQAGSSTSGGATSTGGGSQGGTTSSGGVIGSAGAGTGVAGGSGADCTKLIQDYMAKLDEARKCSADAQVVQCNHAWTRKGPCGCDVLVNGTATDALAEVDAQWTILEANGCSLDTCEIACFAGVSTECGQEGGAVEYACRWVN